MKKNTVLVVMLNPNGWRNPDVFGGGEIQTINTINRINEIGWTLILPEHLRNTLEKLDNKNIKCFPVKPLFKKTNVFLDIIQGVAFACMTFLVGYRERNKFDLVYASTTNFSDIFPSYLISIFFQKKLVSKYHISLYQSNSLWDIYQSYRQEKNTVFDSVLRSVLAKITLFFLQRASKIMVVSHYLKGQLLQCGFSDEKIAVNYNGIDFEKLESLKAVHVSKKYDVCFMGRVEESKGICEFVHLIKNIKKSKKDVRAIVIGDGSFLNDAKKLIKIENLDENIFVTGFLGVERYSYLQQSRVFVSPTYANEGFGLSIIEALYFNVPAVVYTQPVFEEIFSNYKMVKLIGQNQGSLNQAVMLALKEPDSFESVDLAVFSLNTCAQRERESFEDIF